MTDHPALKTPGEILADARKAVAVSVGEMSERTKIPPAMLKAIEQDEYHKISGDLYVKSFLRSYAVELSLDPDEIIELYRKLTGETSPRAGTDGGATVWDEEVQISRVGVPWGQIALIGGVLLVVGALLLYFLRGGDDAAEGEQISLETTETAVDSTPAVVAGRGSLLTGTSVAESLPNRSSDQDSLAAGWLQEAPLNEPAKNEPEPRRESAGPAVVNLEHRRDNLPTAVAADSRVAFADGREWPLVMRMLCDAPLGASVKRDGQWEFAQVAWPSGDEAADPLPAQGIEPGRSYRVRQGLAVYWGAEDHFSLRLDRVQGVEISVNGAVRDVSDLKPGRELILDAHPGNDVLPH